MSIRPFDWRDLPALHRYRHSSVFMHSSLLLTRGPMLIPGALLSYFTPAMGIFTYVSNNNGDTDQTLIGQIIHAADSQYAQLTFLAPESALDSAGLPPLVDNLANRVGERGAFRVVADVDEHSKAYESLRDSSFAIYARQRIWQLKNQDIGDPKAMCWKAATDRDLIAVRSLYYNLVPGLVQQVEPFPADQLHGLVYRNGDEPLAYVELKYGHRGIWAQPFVHPDAEGIADPLTNLLQNLPYRRSRPIYLCIRSYQAWLEQVIENLGAVAGPRQAVMVKHLAVPQKAVRSFALPALEGGHPEVSAPIARSECK
jgi:hypothetical protein